MQALSILAEDLSIPIIQALPLPLMPLVHYLPPSLTPLIVRATLGPCSSTCLTLATAKSLPPAATVAALHALTPALANYTGTTSLTLAGTAAGAPLAAALGPALLALPHLRRLALPGNALAAAGAATLARYLRECTAVSALDLSSNRLSLAAAAPIAAALPRLPLLADLSLSHNPLSDDGLAVLAAALRDLPTLFSLDLSNTALTPAGIAALAGTGPPPFTRLTALNLSGNLLPDALPIRKLIPPTLADLNIGGSIAIPSVAGCAVAPAGTRLTALDLSRAPSASYPDEEWDADGVEFTAFAGLRRLAVYGLGRICSWDDNFISSLPIMTDLVDLHLADAPQLRSWWVDKLAAALPALPHLTRLTLSSRERAAFHLPRGTATDEAGVPVDLGVMRSLGAAIAGIPALEDLFMRVMCTRDACTPRALREPLPTLRHLALDLQHASKTAARAVTTVLSEWTGLERLWLQETCDARAAVWPDVSALTLLTELRLRGYGRENEAPASVLDALIAQLEKIPRLQVLQIRDVGMLRCGAEGLAARIPCWPHLIELDVGDNLVDPAGLLALAQALPAVPELQNLDLEMALPAPQVGPDEFGALVATVVAGAHALTRLALPACWEGLGGAGSSVSGMALEAEAGYVRDILDALEMLPALSQFRWPQPAAAAAMAVTLAELGVAANLDTALP